MTKQQFMRRMHFPTDWQHWEMYPDELYQLQLASYEPDNDNASEHFRNGAFHWWLKREMADAQLIKLIFLTAQDPDQLMAKDVRRYFRRRTALPKHMAEFLSHYEALETELNRSMTESSTD